MASNAYRRAQVAAAIKQKKQVSQPPNPKAYQAACKKKSKGKK